MKLWSGRFESDSHPALDAINKSIDFDVRLWPFDIQGSRAHSTMLGQVGLLDEDEVTGIHSALDRVEDEFRTGSFEILDSDEDIHTAVERRVTELVGDAGKKLHTGRSRNDQVATDMRLFCLDAIEAIQAAVRRLIEALVTRAADHPDAVLPAYTHLQRGQAVLFTHHALAYVEMLRRDHERLDDAARRMRVSPLGAGACAGTSLPIDRELTARELGFVDITRNSLDAVSDRDFVLELLGDLSILMVHISRMGEELVLWSSAEFAFCTPDDSVSTGSSMMPQKKNPDGAELMRAKAGRVFGSLTTLLTALKGLPLAYNKDMQEDKEPLFDAVDTALLCLEMATVMWSTLQVRADHMRRAVTPDVYATDLAEKLVQGGLPLREAHAAVARLVKRAVDLGKTIDQLNEDEIRDTQGEEPSLVDGELIASLTLDISLSSKDQPGSTAPNRVADAIDEAKGWLKNYVVES